MGDRERQDRNGGEGIARPQDSEPYLGCLLPILDPKRSRVWLQKILYVWRLRGRHRPESHSERTVQMKRWRLPRRWLKMSDQRGHMSACGRVFSPSACHLSISLGRCGSVTWRLCGDHLPVLRARLRLDRPSQQLGFAHPGLLKLVRGLTVDARAVNDYQIRSECGWCCICQIL